MEKALNLEDGKYGKVNFDARYRYEYVDQERVLSTGRATAIDHPANASTLRIRLGYLTPEWQGFKAFAEYEGNQDIGTNDYNSTRNGKTAYPLVVDPQANELNQLWLNYAGLPDSSIKVGRQRIAFDNHRFIGDVGWRQMQQTFDAATITNKSLPDTTITAGYIWKVQDITSRSIGMNSPIFNIAYTGLPFGKVTVHGEWLDYDNTNELRNLASPIRSAAPPKPWGCVSTAPRPLSKTSRRCIRRNTPTSPTTRTIRSTTTPITGWARPGWTSMAWC
ncbi:alginate export family protein [Methylogaea oryzae]|uniref:alginate export family protein n=1 Tax=Methylogaea oryzae TaxID=1295382 RepID=UPI0006CF209A|nr:alginate export family protein [Methylogaea oryzae]